MLPLRLKGLCNDKILFDNDEILDMELEALADIFLMDFSEALSHSGGETYKLNEFMQDIIQTDVSNREVFDVRCAISEAFQWLYNNGYIARLLLPGSSQIYFITRAGEERLLEEARQVLKEWRKENLADGEIPGSPTSGNSEDY